MPPPKPFYISAGSTSSFAVFHPARPQGEGEGRRPPVLFCSPWGWEDVASYRVRREWAMRLASAGFPTLRFDLPATGNSSGAPSGRGAVADWLAAIVAAAAWLAEAQPESGDVAAFGFGLGGLLALMAVTLGAPIGSLALWGSPASGRRFAREAKAFSRMQAWYGPDQEGFDPGVPEGWLEAGGFALGPETLAELAAAAPSLEQGPGSLRRLLALDRDGVAIDPGLLEEVENAGVEVSREPGPGWQNFVSHPEQATIPTTVADSFERWLADPGPGGAAAVRAGGAGAADPTCEFAADGYSESALALEQDWGRTVGILASPSEPAESGLCAVFLNAGAVRSTGPSRLWVETARRWAARGVPSLRLDLQGIGEADGEPAGALQVADFYQPRYPGQVEAVLDELERRGVGSRFLLVGLCAGAYWAFRSAVADRRVVATVELNAGALRWDDDLLVQREARKGSRAFERRWWRKLLRGEIATGRLGYFLRSMVLNLVHNVRDLLLRPLGRRADRNLAGDIEADLDVLRDARTSVLVALSGDEPLGEEVELLGLARQPRRWPNASFVSLPGSDHTLRPLSVQRAAAELLDGELERVLADQPAASLRRG